MYLQALKSWIPTNVSSTLRTSYTDKATKTFRFGYERHMSACVDAILVRRSGREPRRGRLTANVCDVVNQFMTLSFTHLRL